MSFSKGWAPLAAVVGLVLACGCEGSSASDAGFDAPAVTCGRACDDGVFCNGVERCAPRSEDADQDGCVAGTQPCEEGCDEAADACESACATADADGDGHDSTECGGDDCDDRDASRFPGNVEVCDADGVDEDCNPLTLGADGDADGFVDESCCNLQVDGALLCGEDCDDSLSGVNPGAPDGCGGGDQDCDGSLDEEPDATFFRDQDSDNYGTEDDTLDACAQPAGYAARGGDCSDDPFVEADANTVNPGATEVCDSRDNDCDGGIDEGLTCECMPPGIEEPCGFDPALDGHGVCRLGTHTCRPEGMWTSCVGATAPSAEACNDVDDDCDDMVDEHVQITCWADGDGDGYAVKGDASNPTATLVACHVCPEGWTDRDPTMNGADCEEDNADRYPGAPEVCNRIDDDCDRVSGEERSEDLDRDMHTAIGFADCTGGFPKDDCRDDLHDVHPGQTRYFADGYCRADQCPCNGRCDDGGGLGGICPACWPGETGEHPATEYDYDCDSVEERRPSRASCPGFCRAGTACIGDHLSYGGSPACGSTVTVLHCGSGACGECTGAGPPTSGQLPCR